MYDLTVKNQNFSGWWTPIWSENITRKNVTVFKKTVSNKILSELSINCGTSNRFLERRLYDGK